MLNITKNDPWVISLVIQFFSLSIYYWTFSLTFYNILQVFLKGVLWKGSCKTGAEMFWNVCRSHRLFFVNDGGPHTRLFRGMAQCRGWRPCCEILCGDSVRLENTCRTGQRCFVTSLPYRITGKTVATHTHDTPPTSVVMTVWHNGACCYIVWTFRHFSFKLARVVLETRNLQAIARA